MLQAESQRRATAAWYRCKVSPVLCQGAHFFMAYFPVIRRVPGFFRGFLAIGG